MRWLAAVGMSLLLAAAPARATITYVGRVASTTVSTTSTSTTLTASRTVTAGDAIVVAVLLSSTSTTAANVVDSAGNTYALDRDQDDGSAGDRVLLFSATSAKSLPSGGTITITYPSSAECNASVDEFTGIGTLERAASAFATGTTFNSGASGTTSQASELILGVVGLESGNAPVFAAGWTALPTLSIVDDRLTLAYQIASSVGSFTASGTISGTWMAAVLAYPGSGPPPEMPPVAALTVTQATSPALTVSASAAGSTDTDATPIASYSFSWGDGSAATVVNAPAQTASHTYAAAGVYTVTLTATDTGNLTSTPVTKSIAVVADAAPVASLAVTQLSSPALTVSASAAGSTDTDPWPIASYSFNWGDGSPATVVSAPAQTATHAYAAAGTYTVTLTATDTGSLTSAPVTKSIAVVGDAAPIANLAVTQLSSPALTVSASAAGSTDTDPWPIASYSFNWGDGSAATVVNAPTQTATHTYAAVGTYTVTLTATDSGNLTSTPVTKSIAVVVDAAPIASLAVTQLTTPMLTVSSSAAGSTDTDPWPIASYSFDWGDGSPATVVNAPAQTAIHTYGAAGTYTVTLVATDTGALASAPVTKSIAVVADAAPIASLAVAQLSSPALTVSASAAGSTDTDLWPIASYSFSFGDGSSAVVVNAPAQTATHAYAAAGTYTVTLVATDAANLASTPATASITVNPPALTTTLEVRVAASSDDAEENASHSVNLTSPDLQLIHDTTDQTVGMRWAGLTIPPGATITAAWIQFSARIAQNGATSLTFNCQAADNAGTFRARNSNVSGRARTTASKVWAPAAWNAGETGPNERTPDLSAVVQEVVNRTVWASGNALAVIVTGTGARTAWAYDGNAALAPLLHVEYSTTTAPSDQPPVANLAVTQASSPPLTASASAAGSTDTDSTPIASYSFSWGDGSAATVVNAPAQTATHTYAAAGTYTVTLTATDTGGLTSAPVTASITVTAATTGGVAVYAGYYDTHHASNPRPKPNPWLGSPNVVFVGKDDDGKGNWDTSCIRVDNNTGSTLSGVVVTCDIGSNHYALWGSQTIPAGYKLILAQTAFQNFDGSDTSPAGCYGCDPSLCLTEVVNTIPVVHVTINGVTTNYYDRTQVLNTGGADLAGCPDTGGTRNDESTPWTQIFASGSSVIATSFETFGAPQVVVRRLELAAPAPNPVRDEVLLQFTVPVRSRVHIGIYDVAGRLVKTWLDREMGDGSYRQLVNVSGVNPGVYYCLLTTSSGSVHRPVVVSR